MSSLIGVEIRPFTLEDTRPLWEAVRESLPELMRWMPWCHEHYSIEEANAWLQVQIPAFQAGSEFGFAIVDDLGHCVGVCGLNQIDKNQQAGKSWILGPDLRYEAWSSRCSRWPAARLGIQQHRSGPHGNCDRC